MGVKITNGWHFLIALHIVIRSLFNSQGHIYKLYFSYNIAVKVAACRFLSDTFALFQFLLSMYQMKAAYVLHFSQLLFMG